MNKVVVADQKVDFKCGVDYIGITVVFVVHDGEGNILLQKRSKNCRDEQGKWDVGGGALEFGEKLEDGVRREIQEELLSECIKIDFLGTFEAFRENEGIPTHWMAFVHAVQVDPKTVKIGEPHKIDKISWFNPNSLPKPLHSQFHKSYLKVIEHLKI